MLTYYRLNKYMKIDNMKYSLSKYYNRCYILDAFYCYLYQRM